MALSRKLGVAKQKSKVTSITQIKLRRLHEFHAHFPWKTTILFLKTIAQNFLFLSGKQARFFPTPLYRYPFKIPSSPRRLPFSSTFPSIYRPSLPVGQQPHFPDTGRHWSFFSRFFLQGNTATCRFIIKSSRFSTFRFFSSDF